MKVAYFDLECWDLTPEFGPLLCASVLSLPDDSMTTLRQDLYVKRGDAEDMTDDRQLCLDLRDMLEEHHITAGYFSKGFDLSHLRTRLAMYGERPLKEMLHMDPIWYAKGWRGIKPKSSKMKHVAEFFGFEQKPEISPETWLKARGGNRKALIEVQDRCEADVRITRLITERMIDLGFAKNLSRY